MTNREFACMVDDALVASSVRNEHAHEYKAVFDSRSATAQAMETKPHDQRTGSPQDRTSCTHSKTACTEK